jgi:hypothetical protein
MSFKTQIEAIVGDIDSPDYTSQASLYLEEGVKFVTRYVSFNDDMANRMTTSTTLNSSPTTMSTASVLKIVSVTRNDGSRNRKAMQIQPEDAGDYTDVNSIYYTSKLDPKYYVENGTLNVIPTPANGQSALVKHISPDTSVGLADSSIDNFPDELERGVVLYASREVLRLMLANVSLPTVPTVVTLNDTTLGSLSTAPTYDKPSLTTNYGTLSASDTTSGTEADFGVDDFIADEDPEMASVALQKQQQLLQQYAADIENELNEFNKELAIYTTDLEQKIQAARVTSESEAQEIQDYLARVESYNGQVNAHMTDYQWYLEQLNKVEGDLSTFLSLYIMQPTQGMKDYETPADDRVS